MGSQFTQATLPPAFTCTVAGWNTNDRMKMSVAPAALAGAVQLALPNVAVVVARSEKQAASPMEATTSDSAMTASAFEREEDRGVI